MAYEYESNLRAGETAGEGLGDRDRGTTGVEKCRSVEHSLPPSPTDTTIDQNAAPS